MQALRFVGQRMRSAPIRRRVDLGMNLHVDFGHAHDSLRVRWVMSVAWVLIAIKCGLVWWAVEHWSMPFHPLWIVAPTLAFAGLATVLWLVHNDEAD